MPLTYSGRSAIDPDSFDTNYEAHDGKTRVIVTVSREAVDDHGLSAALAKGSEKYDRAARETDGRVTVRTNDFK